MTTIFSVLANHPLLAGLAMALAVLVLLLPYHLEEWTDRRGRRYSIWQSLLWRWEFGPAYERLHIDGLCGLQQALLKLLREAWAVLRGDLLRWAVDELKWRLGF